jgi:hypothetical protein
VKTTRGAVLGLLLVFLLVGCDQFTSLMLSPAPNVVTEPPSAYLVLGNDDIQMDQGSYCWTVDGMGLCADIMPLPYAPDQHHTIRSHTFTLRFDDPLPIQVATSMSPGYQVLPNLDRTNVSSTLNDDGTVTVRLPSFIEGDYVLDMFALWEDEEEGRFEGDSLYVVPVRITP